MSDTNNSTPDPSDIEAARKLLEANGWRCVPPDIKENVVYWTNDGTPHGAQLQPLPGKEGVLNKH